MFKVIMLGDGNEALVLADGDQIVDIDYDGDQIDDVWEQETVGSTGVMTLTSDHDGDGILDVDEYVLDFDPTSPEQPFAASIVWNDVDSVDIRFGSKSSRNYLVQYCNDLASGVGTSLVVQAGNDGVLSLNDDPLAARSGFYRVEVFVP